MGYSCNYMMSALERVLIQPRNMMLWFLLLGAAGRVHQWRCAAKAEEARGSLASVPVANRDLESTLAHAEERKVLPRSWRSDCQPKPA